MLVSAKVHFKALAEAAKLQGRVDELDRRVVAQDTTINLQWVRITQLEKERAILFRQVTHLPIPVPEIIQSPVRTSADHIAENWAAFEHVEDEKVGFTS